MVHSVFASPLASLPPRSGALSLRPPGAVRRCRGTRARAVLTLLLGALFLAVALAQGEQEKKKGDGRDTEKKAPAEITEAITVSSETPKEMPVATVSVLLPDKIEAADARDLAEVLSYTSGTYVSVGSKDEWRIKIRGLDTGRTTLLYDGIPVYEPYFNSYDLKTFMASDIERIQVIKGASSVLYGPNTLGGIIELITRRPDRPSFSAELTRGENETARINAYGNINLGKFIFLLGGDVEKSDGFCYRAGDRTTLRANSDYERNNILGKVYYYPRPDIELLGEFSWFNTNYGIPWALEVQKANYWRFADWDRCTVSFGGTTPSFNDGFLKFRAFYVSYYNVLDAYKNASLTTRQWRSTYDNYSWGFFVLNTTPFGSRHELRTSVNFHTDKVRQQSDLGKPWEVFTQDVLSVGAEDYIRLNSRWGLQVGASVDYLMKEEGEGNNKARINPLVALKYNPTEDIDLRLTLSRKSRFPSMKNLYGSTGGNPDLRDETGANVEFGAAWRGPVRLAGAVFYNRLKDLIERKNLSDGTYININISQASIAGFEAEASRSWEWVDLSANYTFLQAENLSAGVPLDLTPKNQFNAFLTLHPKDWFRFSFWGIAASSARYTASNGSVVRVPGYAVFNASLERKLGLGLGLICKLENVFNKAYVTEPGFPMRARTFTAGIRFNWDAAPPTAPGE
ncbi:MAG: TonB-dependent receptor [Acidobacteria bacterium]|nr:TonB-dependent receptor [Acidobacteriota bacterium]